jgi:hypothetical protein
LVLLGVAVVVAAEGLRLGIGWSSDGPEPGFFVFYLGVALFLSTAAVVVQAWSHDAGGRTFVERRQLRSVGIVLVPAVLMVALTHFVGLYVSGLLYLAAYMRLVGRHSWPTTVAIALLVPTVAFLVFEVWFLVPLPKGPLEAALGY